MKKIIVFLFVFVGCIMAQTDFPEIDAHISEGNFTKATEMIHKALANPEISEADAYELNWKILRMKRIKRDFRRTKEDLLEHINKYYPEVTDEMWKNWEENNKLEYKVIDGEKKYFAWTQYNLFRVDKDAKQLKKEKDGESVDRLDAFLQKHIPEVVEDWEESEARYVNPVKMHITYTLTVDANTVPEGEMIRCWLPYPREEKMRQRDVHLLNVNCKDYVVAPNHYQQRTLYMQKPAVKDEPTVFQYELTYKAWAEFNGLDFDAEVTVDKNRCVVESYTKEEETHVIFTDEIKRISEEIIGDETSPLKKVKLIYDWIDNNFPWASAREYSTIPNIPMYVCDIEHGDCGQVTLLFMTLARYNGIPAKWQSGWMLHPKSINLHDWCEIYLDGYGWVPIDMSFGRQGFEDEQKKYFYIGGMDAYRFIVNDAYSKELFPAKTYPRSETVDFQRGEVEWKGGNLYFDRWDYHMDVEYYSE